MQTSSMCHDINQDERMGATYIMKLSGSYFCFPLFMEAVSWHSHVQKKSWHSLLSFLATFDS